MGEAAILQLALLATEKLLEASPKLFIQFQDMVAKSDITVPELKAKRKAIVEQKFEDLVTNSQLPA